MITYFIGTNREFKKYKLTIQFPSGTIHVWQLAHVMGRTGPAIVFIGAEAYDLRDYVAIRNQLRVNHPDGLIIRLL